jgi:oligopeptide/dipeptide ABC transporter ATP-binding protein
MSEITHAHDTEGVTTAPLLTVDDLSISVVTRAGTARVVTDLSFDVPRGGSLGIVGESGSGKSMTAMAIAGLLPRAAKVQHGSIRVDGFEMVGASGRALREVRGERIGMVFQDPLSALNPAFTVGDQISERLRYVRKASRSAAWERSVALLDEVGIPNAVRRAHDYPHQFSGGMRQRIVIAAAIACEPTVLIADEPTTALDVTEVLHRPLHPYSEALLASVPDPDHYQDDLRVIRGTPPTPALYPPFCRFADRCDHAMDICRSGPVELRVTEGRRARCVLVDEGPR